MINILCFGDSNTFGTRPGGGRWPRDRRWTGLLQRRLGEDYYVIEEGCGGRTAAAEDFLEGDKNGLRHLPVALHSHRPLDLVILMLGTNDLKHRFGMLPVDAAAGAERLGRLAETYDYGPYPTPRILLVSPIHIGEGVGGSVFPGFDAGAAERSRQLAPLYRRAAEARGWLFLDAAETARPSPRDLLHMEAEDHAALAEALEGAIRGAFEEEGGRWQRKI